MLHASHAMLMLHASHAMLMLHASHAMRLMKKLLRRMKLQRKNYKLQDVKSKIIIRNDNNICQWVLITLIFASFY